MQAQKRQRVGTYGLEVTQFSLGGTGFGNMYSKMEEQVAMETVATAYDAGIRYFDTAPLYGYGLSEERLGAGLARFERDEVAISTKVGYTLVPMEGERSLDGIFIDVPALDAVFDFSRDAIMRSLDQSMERLQTERIDIVLIHDPDEGVTLLEPGSDPYSKSHFEEVMERTYPALDELRSQGVIKALGLGMNQWEMLADFARAGDFDCFLLAGRYTLLEQEPVHQFLPLCQEKDIRIIVGGPYNSGILATGAVEDARYNYVPASEQIVQRVRRIEAICARHQVSLQAAALQFPFGHAAVASIIPGAGSGAEIQANIAFFEEDIPVAFWAELKSEELVDPAAPLPGQD